MREIPNPFERLSVIAKEYVSRPANTLVISPDNDSRRQINQLIHRELQSTGKVQMEEHKFPVLTPRQDMTGAERRWAARYEVDNVIRYTRGSDLMGLKAGDYAKVTAVHERENLLSVRDGIAIEHTYDPRRLHGVTIYRELEQNFSVGDRIQFTAPDKELQTANRELGTIERLNEHGEIGIRLDSGRSVEFSIEDHRHLDHGYAVTSHSSQGLTADHALLHIDTAHSHPDLINTRLACVSVSRARFDVEIFTDNAESLTESLGHEVSKTSALELTSHVENNPGEQIEAGTEPAVSQDIGTESAADVIQGLNL